MKGLCLVHHSIKTEPIVLDYTYLANAGIRVVCRVQWGYADGEGTPPPPKHAASFAQAVIATIRNSSGVWGWHILNEPNNPAEWSGGYPHVTHIFSPEKYVEIYNDIWQGVRVNDLVAPAPLDPYNVVAREFGQPGDPKDWADYIYDHVTGADFVALHAKTQGADPAECWSGEKFSDAPLTGRYLHLRTTEDQLSWIPTRYRELPVYVTEVNPQRQADGSLGWDESIAVEWIRQSAAYFRTQPVDGIMYYRYDVADPWGLAMNTAALNAIEAEA